MTLFQVVTIDSPIKLTSKGNKRLKVLRQKLEQAPKRLQKIMKEGLEGIEIAVSLVSAEEKKFFDELIERDLL